MRIRRELEEFLQGATEWPSYRDFQRAGRQKLRDEVTKSGGLRVWAKRLELPYPERKPGYAPRWTEDRVRRDLEEFLHGRDALAEQARVRGGRPHGAARRDPPAGRARTLGGRVRTAACRT